LSTNFIDDEAICCFWSGINKRVVSFTPLPLYSRGKSPCYPLDRRLGGPQSRFGQYQEVKIIDPPGTRTMIPVI
jgi:hypothetical protein